MKKRILFLAAFPLLMAMQCDPEDEPCGNFVEIPIAELIAIENPQQQFSLNDTLWLTATVDRNQQALGRTYDLFTYDAELAYYVEFIKNSQFNSNNYIYLTDEALVVTSGEATQNTFILTKMGDTYHNRTGIKLLESGEYTIRVYNLILNNLMYGDCNFTSFSILTNLTGLDTNNFTFTVE